jgi:sugar/nucleoside kinase (ribokinase family)
MKALRIVVAGHISLDIIPTFASTSGDSPTRIEPGQLIETGPALRSTGGAVANTGLALHRLGVPTTLMGKVSDDLFGDEVLNILRSFNPALAEGMIVSTGETTSYSVVINLPNTDRSFLHCPGVNDTFAPEDVDFERVAGAALFHFGYPPLMRHFSREGGDRMLELFRRVRELGVATSLDMTLPDPRSPIAQIDWHAWHKRVLPEVDFYLPSFEEALFMLDRKYFDQLVVNESNWQQSPLIVDLLRSITTPLLESGVPVVVIKLSEQGLYLRSGEIPDRLAALLKEWGSGRETWEHRELFVPAFQVEVAGTTGAGDSAIAGFLAGVVAGEEAEGTLLLMAAVGAYSVEAADASSGIPSFAEVKDRISSGWDRRIPARAISKWFRDDSSGVLRSLTDGSPAVCVDE